MARGRRIEHLAEERECLEHIRLVDAGQRPWLAARLAALGETKRKFKQPLRGFSRDDQRFARVIVGHDALSHRREQAFGGFPDHDQVDAARVRADDRARHPGNKPRRAYPGI
jgi:hypothetical protein